MKHHLPTFITMYTLACNITIGNYRFRQVNYVEINSSMLTLSDTAIIRLPRLGARVKDAVKSGDPVTIRLGYLGVYEGREFTGYVSRVKPNIPFEIECEDAVHWFKRTNISKAWRDTTLKSVVSYLVGEVNAKHGVSIRLAGNIPDVSFDKFRLNNVSAARALRKVKEEYGLTVYFRGDSLYTGLAYTENLGEVRHSMAYNVISSSLAYRKAEDTRIKVKAVGITPSNGRIEVETGDPEGELRTLFFYNVNSRQEIRRLALEETKKKKSPRLDGGFTTFLVPYCAHGMVTSLADPEHGGRVGRYHIDSVKTTFGTGGARREIQPGILVS